MTQPQTRTNRAIAPSRYRWWLVASLPLWATGLMAATSEDSAEISGGVGSYSYSMCGTTYAVQHKDAGLQYRHRWLDENGRGPGLRLSGAGRREDTVPLNEQVNRHTLKDFVTVRAEFLYDWRYLGMAAGLAVIGDRNAFRGFKFEPLPATRIRLGPEAIHFRAGLLDGGATNSAKHLFDLGVGFASSGLIGQGVAGSVGIEVEPNATYVAAAARVHFDPGYLVLAGRTAGNEGANLTIGFGLRLLDPPQEPDPPRRRPELPVEPAPTDPPSEAADPWQGG